MKPRVPTTPPTPQEIQARRERAGFTQREAAEIIGYSVRTWEAWESGARTMRASIWYLWIDKSKA